FGASIAARADGGFMASWSNYYENRADANGIIVQLYNKDGSKKAGALQMCLTSGFYPVLTELTNGNFVVSWQGFSEQGVSAQMCNADGSKKGPKIQINSYSVDFEQHPSITALSTGGFAVSWTGKSQNSPGYEIYVRQFNSDGYRVGIETRVNNYTMNYQQYSSIAALIDGGFVVSWISDGQAGYGVYVQAFDANGNKKGIALKANTYQGNPGYPSIAGLPNGGFAASWMNYGTDNRFGIYVQLFNADGSKKGIEIKANVRLIDSQPSSAIAVLVDGGFIVSWKTYDVDNGYGIGFRRFDESGNIIDGEDQANTYPVAYGLATPSIAAFPDGGFIISWESAERHAVSVQRFDAQGTKVGLCQPGLCLSSIPVVLPTRFPVPSPTFQPSAFPRTQEAQPLSIGMIIGITLAGAIAALLGIYLIRAYFHRKANAYHEAKQMTPSAPELSEPSERPKIVNHDELPIPIAIATPVNFPDHTEREIAAQPQLAAVNFYFFFPQNNPDTQHEQKNEKESEMRWEDWLM
ncbi:MAG: hypothetical protein V4496_05790, partial [Pseudomonadota bacterium]